MKRTFLFVICAFVLISTASAQTKHSRIHKNLFIYSDVFRQLDLNYVDTINYEMLVESSINAMLAKIDPYTVYIPESKTDDLKFMTTGAYGGIGAVISQRNGKIQIADPYEGMPAQRSDVRAGDYILSIDGKSVKDNNVSEVSDMLKGKPHDKITLLLQRGGVEKPIEKEFEREQIQINPVSYFALVDSGMAYIKLNEFTDKAALEFKSALAKMNKIEKVNSLVIDLRNNGGGIIDEAVKILAFFVPKGTEVVSTKGKNGEVERVYKTTTEPIYPDIKLAVLTNQQSASASEIVAGALQDLDAAVLIGERTFGKGLVQSIQPLYHDGYLKVTTAKYYIPSGRCIQAVDYQHRSANGNAVRVPDSLTSEFKTKRGRIVRDGGGVSPDVLMTQKEEINISYYLFLQYMFFDYATIYKQKNPTIAPALEFEVTDAILADFEKYLIEQKFTYTSETEKQFSQLLDVAKYENLDSIAKLELDALKEKLKPNISQSLQIHKQEVKELLGAEIVKRYYFQHGETAFITRYDVDLKKAKEILGDEQQYSDLLKPQKRKKK